MNFSYDNYNNLFTQHASPSGRTPASTNYTHKFYPHKSCSFCLNPYHNFSNCPSWGQSSNFSYEQRNTNFSNLGFDSNSNFYNPDWSNHSDFFWQAQATGNYTPQYHDLHHPEYPQFENQVLHPSSYDPLPQKSSLEDTLKEFIERSDQSTIQVPQLEFSLEDTLKEFMDITG
jgi:hypothetical protein